MHYCLLCFLAFLTGSLMAQNYSDQYRRLDALANQGKYQSALKLAEQIYVTAEANGREDQLVKALDYRATFTRNLEEDGEQAALRLLEGELADRENLPVFAPLLHLMIGEYYHGYAEQNAYRLQQLTEVAGAAPADFLPLAEYSLPQLLTRSEQHVYRALELARDNRTPLTQLPALIKGGEARVSEVPTLYDLLIDRAMNVLGSSLGSVTDDRPADTESLLLPAIDFCALELLRVYDMRKGTPRKLQLYQQWIGYHLDAVGPALLYADLERMRFVHRLGAPDTAYLAALEQMYAGYADLPQRDRILIEMARLLDREDGQLGARPRVRALELLDRVGEEDEVARVEAQQLRASITALFVQGQVNSFYPRKQHLLVGLSYRNVERVFYRVHAYDPVTAGRESYRSDERLAAALQGKLAASGSQRLAANDDYSSHTTELDLNPLPAGGYRLVISSDDRFDPKRSSFSIVSFQVTDLTVMKLRGKDGSFVQVADRSRGAARPDVQVEIREQNRGENYRRVATRTSDPEGNFTLPTGDRNYRNYQLILTDPATGDRMVTEQYDYQANYGEIRPQTHTTLLTDRALYRPGQTVYVYGLRYRTDRDQLPAILPNSATTVTLSDANGQEVARQEATADAYGRFSLDFELPAGGLTGAFSLSTEGGNASFRVEEYKRPRFAATLEAPETTAPGEEVAITGVAMTYAGPAVAEAGVSYRIYVEEVRWAYGYFRGGGGGGGGERELLMSGNTTTDANGAFSFDFTSPINLAIGSYRRFRFVVEADVADETGETHVATTTFGLRGARPAVAVTPNQETLDRGDSLGIRAISDVQDTTLELTLRILPVTKPNAALLERTWAVPDRPVINPAAFARNFPELAYASVPELTAWPATGAAVYTSALTLSGGQAALTLPADFPVGHYRIEWSYADGTAGEPTTFSVYNSATAELPAGVLYQLDRDTDSLRVGAPTGFTLLSAVDLPLVFAQWDSRRGTEFIRDGGGRKLGMPYTPSEADRGGVVFNLVFVRFNKLFSEQRRLQLSWKNKQLDVTYATFRDKLRPGAPEQWTLTLRTEDDAPAAAAALATMYDASLDQLYPGQGWAFGPYPDFYGGEALVDGSSFGSDYGRFYSPAAPRQAGDTIPQLPVLELIGGAGGNYGRGMQLKFREAYAMRSSAVQEEAVEMQDASSAGNFAPPPPPVPTAPAESTDQPPVQLRTDLQETAFWLPELTAGPDGSLRVSFTSPEALTAWRFRLFAHDQSLNYVISEREIVTQKELMVLPNVPRFLREGDAIELTARVSNMTDAPMDVEVSLELFDPGTNAPVTGFGADAGAASTRQLLGLQANGSETARFPLTVPEGASLNGPLGYRVIARSANFSDGEENVVPVLTDRTLMTVSQPFYLKRRESKTVTLPGLVNTSSPSLTNVSYTFEATTNPAWLALKALPYLMEYPYDCTEQLANRYFANQLAYATVSTKPVLEQVFRKWQSDSTALLSELEQRQDLKNALLTETPWVREAQSETAQRARIADLFQLKRLAEEQQAALTKLAARQESDGSYSWFPGGRANRYMTQYVLETLARMRELQVVGTDQEGTVKRVASAAIAYLDGQLADDYARMFANTKDSVKLRQEYRPSALQVHYLYARGMSKVATASDTEAVVYFRQRASATWTAYGFYEQALIALTAKAGGDRLATTILASLRERALHADEFGMYWKYERGYRWNNLPIETHTRILEAFRSIDPRQDELDEMRLWLLTNKRTNRWPTTKATAAAVYAILNSGETYVAEENARPLEASWSGLLGKELGTRVRAAQETPEAGTGEFSVRVAGPQVNSELGTVKVRNRGSDLIWGGVYWQYTELAERVQANDDGPLQLERELYKKVGDRLIAITENAPLRPGDRVTVRLTLRSDRDLDYVHLKDRRAAAFEPVDALSTYRYQNGLGYYFAPGDLATNFFFDELPKGTYTLEYDLFTTYAGTFSNGLGRVQCMYAPEFGGNTVGGRVLVR